MAFELLVEIPETVIKIFHLGGSAANLGLRCPTVLALKGSIALVNGESGTLYRKYNLPNTNAIVEDCVYVAGSRCFVLALTDRTLITVPEHSKSPSECEIEKWPHQPKSLISLNETELIVYCEGGYISHTSMKDNKVKAPLQTPKRLLPQHVVSGSDFCIGNKNFIGLCYSIKKSNKSPTESSLTLFQYEPIATSSSRWLDSSSALPILLNSSPNDIIVAAVADRQSDSISVVVNNESESFWIKLDSGGSELLRRKLSNCPKHVFCWGGIIWFFDGSCILTRWNNRFGHELKPVELPTGTEGVPCIIAAGADGQGMLLLVACSVTKNGPSHVMKKDLGPLSRQNKLSVLDAIAIDVVVEQNEINKPIISNGICNNLDSLQKKEVEELKEKLYKRTLEDLNDDSRSTKRRRKFHKNMSSFSTDFASKLEYCDALSINDEDWEICKTLVRNGLITMHSNPKLLFSAASNNRLDVLVEAVAYISDLTETQFVQILKYTMSMPSSILRDFQMLSSHVVYVAGEFKNFLENTNKTLLSSPVDQSDDMKQLAACNAIINAVLDRPSSFSQALLSEALQLMNVKSICVLLRSISMSLLNVAELRCQCCDKNNDVNMENAVVFVEALIDAHFLELSLHAVNDSEIRRALCDIIKVVKEAEKSTLCLEETLGLWTQIERVSSKHGAHIKNAVGTYQIEKLTL